jgi:NTP pyrophosphatase (non-canonical NTP hydrolase)
MKSADKVDLEAVKSIISSFAAERAGRPREQLEKEFGDLLLFVIRLAARMDIDLIAEAKAKLAAKRSVPKRSSRATVRRAR